MLMGKNDVVFSVVLFTLFLYIIVIVNVFFVKPTWNQVFQVLEYNHNEGQIEESRIKRSSPDDGTVNKTDVLGQVCLTEGCVHAASEILKKMNSSVDPCNNFYEFVCGKYSNDAIIPYGEEHVSLFLQADEKLFERLRMVLEMFPEENEPRTYRTVKDFYRSCMNTSQTAATGLDELGKVLKLLGGWPVLEGDLWDPKMFSRTNSVYAFGNYGFPTSYLMDASVKTNVFNTSRHVLRVGQGRLSLDRKYLSAGLNDSKVTAMYKHWVDIACLLGADRSRAEIELKEAISFEIKLAKLAGGIKYMSFSIVLLRWLYPSIPWMKYFSTLLKGSATIDSLEILELAAPLDYFEGLEKVLKKTSKRVIANYLFSRAAFFAFPYTSAELYYRQLLTLTDLTSLPHWKYCVHNAMKSLPHAATSIYVKHYVKPDVKLNVQEIWDSVKEELYKSILSADWIDNVTRGNFLEKATAIKSVIAYPDEVLDQNKLEEFYQKLDMTGRTFLQKRLNINKFNTAKKNSKLRELVVKNDWSSYEDFMVVNARYYVQENSVRLPAGILQEEIFSVDRPKYFNYGVLGFIISHELSHAFDLSKIYFDKNGNMLEDEWTANLETRRNYLDKSSCLNEQYEGFTTEDGYKVNGGQTENENFADNSGIKLAYNAYKQWTTKHGEEGRLPGLQKYNPLQMFWISSTHPWCFKYRPDALRKYLAEGTHSPPEFRVLGTLANQPEFAADFNCPLGSKMNPSNKCNIW